MLNLGNYISSGSVSVTVAKLHPRCLQFANTPRELTPSWLLKFPHLPSKLFYSLILQLLKLFCHPLLKTAFILFLPLFTTVGIISSAMCNVDS